MGHDLILVHPYTALLFEVLIIFSVHLDGTVHSITVTHYCHNFFFFWIAFMEIGTFLCSGIPSFLCCFLLEGDFSEQSLAQCLSCLQLKHLSLSLLEDLNAALGLLSSDLDRLPNLYYLCPPISL